MRYRPEEYVPRVVLYEDYVETSGFQSLPCGQTVEIKETTVDDAFDLGELNKYKKAKTLGAKIHLPVLCNATDCDNKLKLKGFCQMHYNRNKRGQPLLGPNQRPKRSREERLEYWRAYSALRRILS